MSPSALALRNRLCLLAAVAVACGGQDSTPVGTSTTNSPAEASAGIAGSGTAGTGIAGSANPGLAGHPSTGGAPDNHAGHGAATAGTQAQAGAGGADAGDAGAGGEVGGSAGGVEQGGTGQGGAGEGGAGQGGAGGEAQGGEAGAAGSSPAGVPVSWDFYDCYDASKTPTGKGKCLELTDGELLNQLLVLPFCGVTDGPAVVASPEGEKCCYQVPPCVGGRPLVLEEGLRHAQTRSGAAWG